MGVLEARTDAEEIGFNYVGEEEKQQSNVVDYNINKEQTKDTSATINANNQTTTGMANVIPGINAPKLIASTSIIGGAGGGSVATSVINLSTSERAYPGSSYTIIDTIDSSNLSPEITTETGGKIYSSTGGTYLISYLVKSTNANVTSFSFSSRNMVQAVYVVDVVRPGDRGVFTAVAKLNPNDYIRSSFLPEGNSCNPKVTMTMVRIG